MLKLLSNEYDIQKDLLKVATKKTDTRAMRLQHIRLEYLRELIIKYQDTKVN